MFRFILSSLLIVFPTLVAAQGSPVLRCEFSENIAIEIAEDGDRYTWDEGMGVQPATLSGPDTPDSFGMITTLTDKGVAVIFVKNQASPKMAILSWPAVRLRNGVEIPDVTTTTGQCEELK